MRHDLVILDVETSIINNGDPFHPDNRLVSVGLYDGENYLIQYKDFNKEELQDFIGNRLVIGHNVKFDIHWLKRIGFSDLVSICRDTQLSEFIISNQKHAYPSLNDCAAKYLNQQKIDVVKEEYWDKGIDTWFIPEDVLCDYLKEDLRLTYEVYLQQEQILKETNRYNLYKLQSADLLVLAEMEFNGILFNKEESIKRGEELNADIEKTKRSILSYTNCPSFNTNSGDHISCLLYGGTILHTISLPVGVYKSGQRIGQEKLKKFNQEFIQERLVEPIKGSELKKEGYWSTDEYTLRSLKPRTKEIRQLIENILHLSKLEKLQGTYYFGIPKLMDKKGWKDNYMHGKFNQCVARTGRLSSSDPNLQNFDEGVQQLCISRYDNQC